MGNSDVSSGSGWIMKWIWNGLPKSIIHMDYGFYMDFLWIFNLNPYKLWIFYGMDMDLGF